MIIRQIVLDLAEQKRTLEGLQKQYKHTNAGKMENENNLFLLKEKV